MEEKKSKKIYFIFSQKIKNNINNVQYHLEKNDAFDNIEVLEKDTNMNYGYIYTFYCISLNNYLNKKSFSIALQAETAYFTAQFDYYKLYPEIFIFEPEFKPMDKNASININQYILPFSEQFYIFRTHFFYDNNIIKYLLLNSFDVIAFANKEKKFDFYFFLYLFGNSLSYDLENQNEKMLETFFNFFRVDSIDIKESYYKNYHKYDFLDVLGTKTVETLNDINMIYTLISSNFNGDPNIINLTDLILAFYYIVYNQKMFVKLLLENENPRFALILENLKKNRKIYRNFSSEILLNFDLLEEATNLTEIYYLFLLVPDIPELIKIMSNIQFFLKLCKLNSIEQKIVNIYKIIKPKEEDNMNSLIENFQILHDEAKEQSYAPFIMEDNLFISYCDIFYLKELNKIEQVFNLYKLYTDCSNASYDKKMEKKIFDYYYETGIALIKTGKLSNKNLLNFLRKSKELFGIEIPFTEEIGKGIIPSDDPEFLGIVYNPIDEKSKKICQYYFNNMTLKDFMNRKNQDIFNIEKIKDIVIKYCFEGLKAAWLKEKKTKINEIFGDFIGHLLYTFFNIFKNSEDMEDLKVFENELNNSDLLMDIYCLTLKKYLINSGSEELKQHIYEYINMHYFEVQYVGIYYLLLTFPYEEQEYFLLNNLTAEYAIKIEDFKEYPKVTSLSLRLYKKLYYSRFLIDEKIQNLEYYKLCISSKDNITSLNYDSATNISKNSADFLSLFLILVPPDQPRDENELKYATALFDYIDLVDYCTKKLEYLKLILSYLNHFFKNKKKEMIHFIENLIKELDNTPIKDYNKFEEKINSFSEYYNDANKYDKLFSSFFFMGIYNNAKNIFSKEEDEERFKYSLMQFDEIKVLSINSDIEKIPYEILNLLVELVDKNKDRLDNELDTIKVFFKFEDNPNFDINRIKKSFLDKVNNYQINNNLDDYQFEFDILNLNENIEKDENNYIDNTSSKNAKKDDTDDGGFTLLGNDDEDDDGFSLFGNSEKKLQKNEIKTENIDSKTLIIEKIGTKQVNEEELKDILKNFNIRLNGYYYINRILKSFNNIEESITFNEKYTNFFMETFKNINKYEKLSNRQFYEKIMIQSLKIFLSGVGINYFKNENNNKKDMYLIYVFFEIFGLYKKYNLLNKEKLFKIIQNLIELKNNEDKEAINIIGCIENLFNEIEENIQKKYVSNLFIRILCLEKNKIDLEEFNHKLVNFSFRNDNNFLVNDIIPFLDEIFKEKLESKINLGDDVFYENNKFISFQESIYEPIEKMLNNSKEPQIAKDLDELILYYFESKLSYIFSVFKNKFENKRDFYQNENIKNYLRNSLFFLEDEYNKKLNINNKRVSLLFNIAFIKCFFSDYINYLYHFNQEIGDTKEINENIIKGNANNSFRTTIKLYILKLFYCLIGNYSDFLQFKYDKYQIYYFQDKDIKFLRASEELNEINNNINKVYGFDYLFIPVNKNEFDEYISIDTSLINISQNNIKENNDLIVMINHCSNLDIFLCSIINIFMSNFKDRNYFDSNSYKNLNEFLFDSIYNNKIVRIKNIIKDILLLFINIEKYQNQVLNNNDMPYGTSSLSYNQILSISISLRFVFNTIINNNKNSLLYQILMCNEKIISKNIFIEFFNKDFSFYKSRNISHLTFAIIRFIVFSHIYFGFLLDKINVSNINYIFINLGENIKLIDLIEKEFNLIQKILESKGIKNIIVFMNNIFNDIKSIIVNIFSDNLDELGIKNMETQIENEISKYLENFSYYTDEYYKMMEKIDSKLFNNNKFKMVITEDKKFYNGNKNEKEYPFIRYLTLTNFCGIEDFKIQFLYLTNDKSNYPLINCLINNADIITITKNLPFINHFINEISNELMLKIRNDDTNKSIANFLGDNIKGKINEYNDKINEINRLESFQTNNNKINEINNDTKIIDVINMKDNSINKMFSNFIKIYNEFLTNTKIYKDNKKIIDSIIIQNATKDDFINLPVSIKKNNNDDYAPQEISIYDRLNALLYLYSKRNRYYKNDLNVYNGSKINYDLTQIENILEKEYLYGKKPFKTEQRNFIFSNEVFSNDRNNIIEELINKYPQEEINDDMIKIEIDKFLNDEHLAKNDLERIYISLQYMIIFLVKFESNLADEIKDNNQNEQKYNLEYVSKILGKINYQISDLLFEFLNNYKDNIGINNLLFLYEKTELKYFNCISEDILKNKVISQENTKSIEEYFSANNNNLVLNDLALFEGTKKYIMRYCIGDNIKKDEIIKSIDINKILSKKCLWYFIIFKNNKEETINDEINKLLKLNETENSLIKYILKKLLTSNKKFEKKKKNKIDNDDDEDDEEERNRMRRRRQRRRIEY